MARDQSAEHLAQSQKTFVYLSPARKSSSAPLAPSQRVAKNTAIYPEAPKKSQQCHVLFLKNLNVRELGYYYQSARLAFR